MKTHVVALRIFVMFLALSQLKCASQAPAPAPAQGDSATDAVYVPPTRGVLYSYSRLALKDLDQMNQLVHEKIQESRKAQDKLSPLREGMQAVYGRPNDDFMIDKVASPLHNELDEHNAWEAVVRSLVEECLNALKKTDKVKPAAQVTYLIMLENFVADMKPRAGETFENRLLSEIRDAKIEISKKAKSERQMVMMRESSSPSDTAGKILKEVAEKK